MGTSVLPTTLPASAGDYSYHCLRVVTSNLRNVTNGTWGFNRTFVARFAGTPGTAAFSGDGAAASSASLYNPWGLAFDE